MGFSLYLQPPDDLSDNDEREEEVYIGDMTYNLDKMFGEAFKSKPFLDKPSDVLFKHQPAFVRFDKMKATDCVESIELAISEMEREPGYFLTFEPSNKWGTYEGGLKYLKNFLALCKKYPYYTVRFSG